MSPYYWCPFKGCDGCAYAGGAQGDSNAIAGRIETAPGGAVNTAEGLTATTSKES